MNSSLITKVHTSTKTAQPSKFIILFKQDKFRKLHLVQIFISAHLLSWLLLLSFLGKHMDELCQISSQTDHRFIILQKHHVGKMLSDFAIILLKLPWRLKSQAQSFLKLPHRRWSQIQETMHLFSLMTKLSIIFSFNVQNVIWNILKLNCHVCGGLEVGSIPKMVQLPFHSWPNPPSNLLIMCKMACETFPNKNQAQTFWQMCFGLLVCRSVVCTFCALMSFFAEP